MRMGCKPRPAAQQYPTLYLVSLFHNEISDSDKPVTSAIISIGVPFVTKRSAIFLVVCSMPCSMPFSMPIALPSW
jgi:hypothetical protein